VDYDPAYCSGLEALSRGRSAPSARNGRRHGGEDPALAAIARRSTPHGAVDLETDHTAPVRLDRKSTCKVARRSANDPPTPARLTARLSRKDRLGHNLNSGLAAADAEAPAFPVVQTARGKEEAGARLNSKDMPHTCRSRYPTGATQLGHRFQGNCRV
jgi:hypothetical protein